MKVKVLVFGAERVAVKFNRMGHDMVNAKPGFKDVGDYLMQITDTQFNSQGRRGGGSWKRLDPKWLKFKAKKGWDLRILHQMHPKSGSLRRSVTVRRATGQVLEIEKDSLNFGSSIPYAARHQFGVQGKTPARPFIRILKTDETKIRNTLRDHIMQAWERKR
jgi:phage gpG-like protein